MHWKQLTHDQFLKLLESHMFLKKKRLYGNSNGQTVAVGNKQRSYITKEDASSPTVSTEDVLLKCIINAEDNRCVVVIDITDALIQTQL